MALFDAAVRLCARSSGAWALTLPGGAAVTWAVLNLADAYSRDGSLVLPSLLFTLAWIFRGVCQAATCHHLDAMIVGERPVSALQSFRAALSRLPSIVITSAYLPLFTLVSVTLTLGLGYFILASHLAGWAVVMKGRGHALALYGTCARMLGPARSNTVTLRMLFWVMFLVGLNLHLAATIAVYLGRKLIGLDLTFAQRFIALDNGVWMAVVAALTFALFEPLRAAVATLLLVDGRVRQEGLDLLAAVEQLPKRNTRGAGPGAKRTAASVLFAVALAGSLGVSSDAWAQSSPGSPLQRLQSAAESCGMDESLRGRLSGLTGLERLGPAEQASLRRLADEVELYADTWEDCDGAEGRLWGAVSLLSRTLDAVPEGQVDAQTRARDILSRPEFQEPAERVKEEAAEEEETGDPDSWWARFTKWLEEFLERLFEDEPNRAPRKPVNFGSGMGAANAIVMVLLGGVLILAGVLLFMAFRNRSGTSADGDVEQTGLDGFPKEADPNNALSRPPETWASMADDLSAQGRHREAVRSLYLALLSRLHRAGAIDYDPTLSNWDYFRRFRGRREWLPAFRDLTLRFDFAWYGVAEVSREDYVTFRALSEPLLRPDANEPQRGAVSAGLAQAMPPPSAPGGGGEARG